MLNTIHYKSTQTKYNETNFVRHAASTGHSCLFLFVHFGINVAKVCYFVHIRKAMFQHNFLEYVFSQLFIFVFS